MKRCFYLLFYFLVIPCNQFNGKTWQKCGHYDPDPDPSLHQCRFMFMSHYQHKQHFYIYKRKEENVSWQVKVKLVNDLLVWSRCAVLNKVEGRAIESCSKSSIAFVAVGPVWLNSLFFDSLGFSVSPTLCLLSGWWSLRQQNSVLTHHLH